MTGFVEDPNVGEAGFARVLGPMQLIAMGVGGTIGTGIFVLTGHAAASFAGPAVIISFAIAGVGCLLAGLCYAELASMIPVAGSAYTYTYATMGKFMAWFIGWDLMLEYVGTSSTVTVGWSGYFNDLLQSMGIVLPASISTAPLCVGMDPNCSTYHAGASTLSAITDIGLSGSYINLPAVMVVACVTVVLLLGVRLSALFNNAMVLLKVGIIVLVVALGWRYISTAHLTPFIPPNTGTWGHFGWSGVLRATGLVFYCYVGFDAVSVTAQEARNPQRDIPVGILGGMFICTALYMLMSYVLTGLADYRTLNVTHPVSMAVAAIPAIAWLAPLVNVAIVVGLASVVLVLLLGQSRICYAMARDGMLPPMFGAIHPKFHTPWKGTLVISFVCALLGGLLPLDLLGELVSIGTLMAFILVCTSVMILRFSKPKLPRKFRTPFLWIVAPLGIVTCGAMMYWLPLDTWLRLLVWTTIGLAIYFCYSRKHVKAPRWSLTEDD